MKYFDNFADHADVVKEFEIAADAVSDAEILYAQYGNGSYDGCARGLFERDGKVFRVDGGHCSCHGLEGQWSPEETSWQAEAMRPREFYGYDTSQGAPDAFWALVDARWAVLS